MLKSLCHGGCGTEVEIRTNPKVYCSACRLEAKRASARATAERRRRKSGVPEVKGRKAKCRLCRKSFVLNRNAHATVCRGCTEEANRIRARQRVRRLCRERGAVEIGSEAPCRRCGTRFVVKASRNRLCDPCGEKSLRMQHPEQRETARSYARRWVAENKDRNALYQRRSRERRKQDPEFTINERMSAGIRQSLSLGKQGWHWESLVDFTLADLMAHLERQFLPGMTWENRGDWHVDHIRPLCSFEFQTPDDPQFREAWALSNLQPLWATDNLSKGGRWKP